MGRATAAGCNRICVAQSRKGFDNNVEQISMCMLVSPTILDNIDWCVEENLDQRAANRILKFLNGVANRTGGDLLVSGGCYGAAPAHSC